MYVLDPEEVISIHAPAKGATVFRIPVVYANIVFQSTLPRRERRSSAKPLSSSRTFQSTLPRRERLDAAELERLHRDISIHAPAKGATIHWLLLILVAVVFQSTLPRRERHMEKRRPSIGRMYFNPRSREGSDPGQSHYKQRGRISIHAPAKGATYYWDNSQMSVKFQSTPPRRERPDR